jgi:hypothetical protein
MVDVQRLPAGALHLTYRVEGDIAQLQLPQQKPPARTDGLWRDTCFEAFLRAPGSSAYDEFNFSPSGEWAAYRFARWHRPPARRIRNCASPWQGKTRRAAGASRVRHQATCAHSLDALTALQATSTLTRRLRPAARPARRQAGQHDGVADFIDPCTASRCSASTAKCAARPRR